MKMRLVPSVNTTSSKQSPSSTLIAMMPLVVAVFPVEDESEIMIITQQGKLIRLEAGDIRKTGRSAQGVRLIKTDQGDKVTSASLVEAAAEEETETTDING